MLHDTWTPSWGSCNSAVDKSVCRRRRRSSWSPSRSRQSGRSWPTRNSRSGHNLQLGKTLPPHGSGPIFHFYCCLQVVLEETVVLLQLKVLHESVFFAIGVPGRTLVGGVPPDKLAHAVVSVRGGEEVELHSRLLGHRTDSRAHGWSGSTRRATGDGLSAASPHAEAAESPPEWRT